MGIDYGRGTIGIALSGPAGIMGFPHSVMGNSKNALEELRLLIAKEQVETIVIGVSKDSSGNDNSIVEEIYAFGNALYEKTGLPVEYEDEAFTTLEASQDPFAKKGERKDAQAAALILSRYLEKHADDRRVQED